jgi:transcriptional regulator GlxA family with amidase domain
LLTEQLLPLHDILSPQSVVHRLAAASTDSERISIIEHWLHGLRSPQPRREVIEAAKAVLVSGGTARIEEVAHHSSLSVRQLERQFDEHVGLPAKTFARVIRVRRAAKLLRRGDALVDTAVACGYYDQAHMARDFRQLATRSPAEWRKLRYELSLLFSA